MTNEALASNTDLEELSLDSTQASNKGLQNLQPSLLGHLRVLNIPNTQVAAQGLAKLKALPISPSELTKTF